MAESSPLHQPRSTAARRAASLPDWPRAMDIELAASYCSISPNTLRDHGPKPVIIGHRKVYLRNMLDEWLDGLAGRAPASAQEANPFDDYVYGSDALSSNLHRRR